MRSCPLSFSWCFPSSRTPPRGRPAVRPSPFQSEIVALPTLPRLQPDPDSSPGKRGGRVRAAAVTRLWDQALLAKVAVEGHPYDREDAVGKLNDQALLADIAVRDTEERVQEAAVERLVDQAVLAKLAVQAKDAYVRHRAVAKLRDRALLAKTAVEDMDSDVRDLAKWELASFPAAKR